MVGIQIVGTSQFDCRARHREREFPEGNSFGIHTEAAVHAGHDLVNLLACRLPLAFAAELIYFVLDGGSEEFAIGDLEGSVELQLLAHFPGERWQGYLRFQKQGAFHERRTLHRKTKHIAKISIRHADVEIDMTTFISFVLDDGPTRLKAR